MKDVLNPHVSHPVDIELLISEIKNKGWDADYIVGISRIRIISNCTISIASQVLEDVMADPCINCGCNPIIKNESVYE